MAYNLLPHRRSEWCDRPLPWFPRELSIRKERKKKENSKFNPQNPNRFSVITPNSKSPNPNSHSQLLHSVSTTPPAPTSVATGYCPSSLRARPDKKVLYIPI